MSMESSAPLEILLIEHSGDVKSLIERRLEKAGYRAHLERVDTRAGLRDALRRKRWDVVFSDFSLPSLQGLDALKIVREYDPDLPFIVISGTIGEERAVQLINQGAQDYVLKNNMRRLIPAVERALKDVQLRREHRIAQEHIEHLAYYNALTRLPNRHRLLEDVDRQIGEGTPLALMIVNLTNFREINGALGYGKGDEIIREAAERLQELHIKEMNLYHLYGNEFALLVVSKDRAHVESIAHRVLRALAPHYRSAGYRIHIGARMGIVASPVKDASRLLQRADLAATLAKREGKSYAWYEPELDPSSPERLALLADLHDAIGTDQLFLVFQPKVQSGTGAITGCEALLRWEHPEHGTVMPEVFIEMAEQSGLIDDLTHHVLMRVAAQAAAWQARNLALPISLNLSVKNLLNPQLMTEILRTAVPEEGRAGLEIEITETALMQDPDRALMALRQLYDAGIRIAVDDFGIGFSSLGYLKRLPIHAIKIDKSFVIDLTSNPDSDAIVRSTIGLAHNLALKVVAEGVEDRAIWQRLTQYHCDEGQGNYFGTPLAAAAFEATLGAWLPRSYAQQ
ncbi:MAG: EAL domain-containing protein [Sulfurifustaceae bacterium]